MSLSIVFLTLGIFLVAVLIMSVGVIFKRPCLRGSCGGPEVLGANGESLSCSTCPNRKKRESAAADGSVGLPVVQ
ncbi:MAG: (Na+)-NQR maturation NqrM [Acidobacteriota bacterium]